MGRRIKGTGRVTRVYDETHKMRPWRAYLKKDHKTITRYFKSKKEAEAFLREESKRESFRDELIKDGVTFDAFYPLFLSFKEPHLKPVSYATLVADCERVSLYLGKENIRAIDNAIIQAMVNKLAERGLSKSMMKKSVFAVTSCLRYAAAEHLISAVPVVVINYPKSASQKKGKGIGNNWLTEDERARYEEECRRLVRTKSGKVQLAHSHGHTLLLLLHTGLRIGEALALTWDDYDEYSQTLSVTKNLIYIDGEKLVQTPKTQSGERLIVLTRQAAQDLLELRKRFDQQSAAIEAKYNSAVEDIMNAGTTQDQDSALKALSAEFDAIRQEHRYICGAVRFPFGKGYCNRIEHVHKEVCEAIDLPHRVTVHGLRHTYVTHYYLKHKNDTDFDLATFSKSIGHSNSRTTMEIYAHLEMTENKMVRRQIEDLKDF